MLYSSVAVDLMRPNNMTRAYAVQGDSGRGLDIYLKMNGLQVDPNLVDSVTLCMQRPDEVVRTVACDYQSDRNCYRVDIPEVMFRLKGKCLASVRVNTDGETVTSPPFVIEVFKNATIGASPEFVLFIRNSEEI